MQGMVLTALIAGLVAGAGELGFEEAVALAARAPDVAGTAAAAQLQRKLAGEVPTLTANPTVLVQPQVRHIEQQGQGPELQLGVSQAFNLSGLGAARREGARREAESTAAQARALETERRLAAAAAWLEAWSAQATSQLAAEEEEQSRKLVPRVQRALALGGATRPELAEAQAFEAEARLEHLDWEGRRVEAGVRLGQLLGLAHAVARVDAALPTPLDAAALAAPGGSEPSAERAADVRAARAGADEARARDAETRAERGWQLQLGAGGAHEYPNNWYGYAGASLTLPAWELGQRERALHQAELARKEADAEARAAAWGPAWEGLRHECEHAREVLEILDQHLVPAAVEAATLEQELFVRGESTLPSLLRTRRLALAARARQLQARAQRALADFKLAEAQRQHAPEAP
jgi:outer membrane protein TolC